MPIPRYTVEELMACVIAREVRDGETCATGMASPLPAAGLLLAQAIYAPRARIIILEHPDPRFNPFPDASGIHFLAQRGKLDLFFLSGIQIDRFGNFNLHVIGDYYQPRVRMPGAYGSGMLYYMAKRVILFRTEHTRRTFVERVDFISGAGSTPPTVYRPGGPYKCVTPMAVLRFRKDPPGWELESVHPGHTVEEVQANTGFPLELAADFRTTPEPTQQELRALRTTVRERLAPAYPQFAQEKIVAG
ncbi:MAG: CoA synthetase [Dehalococcoidia bacterium]|nr:CoA synthetase [Dehalococcoidia bacterium]MDW8120330.1 CoA-transferase [Chloroflexota bacterium]